MAFLCRFYLTRSAESVKVCLTLLKGETRMGQTKFRLNSNGKHFYEMVKARQGEILSCRKCRFKWVSKINEWVDKCPSCGVSSSSNNRFAIVNRTVEFKSLVHIMTQIAIKEGVLIVGPCEKCGATTEQRKIAPHHKDYFKPLEVNWLCYSCHQKHHKAKPKG